MAKRYSSFSLASLSLALLVSPLAAQGGAVTPLDEAGLALNKAATKVLLRFSGFAKSKKFGPMEKTGYELVISDYDPENKRARRGLDYRKDKKGEWNLLPPLKRKEWFDQANRKGRFAVQQEWRKTCLSLAKQHRELGLQMIEGDGEYLAKGSKHLRLAILFNPLDQVAHEALGHVGYESGGVTYFGTEVEVAFMKSMREIETFALELAKKDYNPKPVDEIPEELQKTGLEFFGAKTEHFTIFVRGTQENAFDVVEWGERALDFFEYMAGDGHKRNVKRVRKSMKNWGYTAFLWTTLEKDEFIKQNPGLVPKGKSEHFSNIGYTKNGRWCQVLMGNAPAVQHDKLIAYTWHRALTGTNDALLEGVHHAATWFLKSTCIARFGAVPEGTETGRKLNLPDGANWWLREMRNQSLARTDVPINVVPRTRLAKFHPDVRLKTWSWHVWGFARFPDKWLDFLLAAPPKKIPFPEEIDKIGAKALGIPLKEAEEQWRDWASGRGVTAAATGYGPPLLPEFPNDDELDGLDRLNAVRRAASTFALPGGVKPKEGKGGKKKSRTSSKGAKSGGQWAHEMPECELDSEATAACKEHAIFLGLHESHRTWPEAHEENPALEGFSPRGMRAAARSVIIWSNGQMNSERAVDGWVGTVYHRFPLLEYNIKRFGMAFDDSSDLEIMVLDMGSLEEPRTDALERACGFVAWPPAGMKNVPRQFSYRELPNPLEDVGIEPDGQKNTGYPVSLQFTRLVMANSSDVTMKLFEAKKRGKTYEKGDEIACWLHTPDEPLLKRMVMRNVVFVIPKDVLPGNKSYKAVVSMTVGGAPRKYEWVFTTGNQLQGLGKLK